MPTCSVDFCRSFSAPKSGIHYHRFPTDIERCKLWVNVCGANSIWLRKMGLENLNTSAYRICSLHFEDSMYSAPNVKLRLKGYALPTLKIFSNNEEDTAITGTSSITQENTSSNQSAKQDDTSSSHSKIRKKKSSKFQTSKIDSRPAVITVTPEITCASMMNFHSDDSDSVDNWIKKEETEYNFQYVNTDVYDEEESLNGAELDNTDTLFSVSSTMCRLCLQSGNNLHPFFTDESDKQDKYRETVLSSVPIKVEKDDGLPQYICESCYNSLVQWHDFREMCISSNNILRQNISNMPLSGNSKCSKVIDNNPINPENNEPQSDFTKCARQLSEVTSANKKIKDYKKRCRKEPTCRKKMKTASPLVDGSNINENMDPSYGVDQCEIRQSLEDSPLSENFDILTDATVNKHDLSKDKLLLNNNKSFLNVSSIDEPHMTSNNNLNKISSNTFSSNGTSDDLLLNAISNNKLEQFIDEKSEYELLLNKTSINKQLSNMTSNDKLIIKTSDNKLLLIRTVHLTSNEKQLLNVTLNSL